MAKETVNNIFSDAFDGKQFTLPKLPYAYDALKPMYDEQTLKLHHDKHHAAYVKGLNDALAKLDAARKAGDAVAAGEALLPGVVVVLAAQPLRLGHFGKQANLVAGRAQLWALQNRGPQPRPMRGRTSGARTPAASSSA